MTFYCTGPLIGPNLTNVDASKKFPLGTIVDGKDTTYGAGKFIYLKGVASTVLGDAVVYDEAFATTRAVAASRGNVAVALAAVVADKYGWYQIQGMAVVRAGTVSADAKAQVSATPGQLDDTTTAAQDIAGARFMTADGTPSAGYAIISLDFPFANGTLV